MAAKRDGLQSWRCLKKAGGAYETQNQTSFIFAAVADDADGGAARAGMGGRIGACSSDWRGSRASERAGTAERTAGSNGRAGASHRADGYSDQNVRKYGTANSAGYGRPPANA